MNKNLFKSESASKASLFKSSTFTNPDGTPMDEVQRKNTRTKIRKYIAAAVNYFNSNNTFTQEMIQDFIATYNEFYAVNDFTVASIYNGSDDTKKAGLQKLLDHIKANAPKDPTPAPTKKDSKKK